MKMLRIKIILSLLLLLSSIATAHAGGIGLFLSSGQGSSDWEEDNFSFEADTHQFNLGFVVDSNVATNRLFNYRFELSRSYLVIENFNNTGGDAELDGLMMAHDFGFGALITPTVRFWFGPEFRLTFVDGDLKGDSRYDTDMAGYGVGAVAGLNINLPHRLTLSVKSGFVIMRYAGDGEYYDNASSSYRDADYLVDENLSFITLAIMFRTGRTR